MAFEYLDHEADMGIRASGETPESAFAEGARAMFGVMVDLSAVRPLEKSAVKASAESIDSLFVEFLNALLSEADRTGRVFSKFDVKIKRPKKAGSEYELSAEAWGEPLDQKRHRVKIEVKAATYSGLKCWSDSGRHYVQCVLDL